MDDLSEIYAEKWDIADYYTSFLDGLRFEDKLYGLPQFSQPTSRPLIMINIDMFEQAGVPVPEGAEWDVYEWRDAAMKLSRPDDGVFGAQPANVINYYDWEAFVDGFDSHIVTDEVGLGRKFNWLDNPRNKDAVDWYLSFVKSHAAPRRGEAIPKVNMFAAQLYATTMAGVYEIPGYRKEIGDKFRWDMYLMRGPVRRGTGMFINNWSISSDTEYPDEAFDLIAGYLCGKEIGLWSFQTGVGNGLGGRRSQWNSDIVANDHPGFGVMRDWMNEEGDSFNPFPFPWNLRFQELYDTSSQNTMPLAYMEATWDEQSPIIQAKSQAVMDLPRP